MSFNDIPWPSPSQDLLKLGDDWTKFAQLDFLADREVLYSEGYKEAADLIAKHLISNRSGIDLLIYPLFFLYRHHVELSLKEIIQAGNRLLNRDKVETNYHEINSLWSKAKYIITEVWTERPTIDVAAVDKIMLQLHDLDPKSFAFRYHVDRFGENSISDLSKLDIVNLKLVLDGLSNFLGGVSSAISDYLDNQETFAPDY